MITATTRTARYVSTWMTGRADVAEDILTLHSEGGPVRAKFAHPARGDGPWPGWIVLHGITRRGVEHVQLSRFTKALASTGAAVLVPEVPRWRELDLAPGLARETIKRSIGWLAEMDQVRPEPYGVVGFSFGAPHGLASLSDAEIEPHVAGAVAFGGYCRLESTIHFMFTGTHDYGGEAHSLRPDPYGRWIVAANYLTAVPGLEDAGDVARELRALAALAGDTGPVAWDPVYDSAKVEARARVADSRRHLFDLIAPPSNEEPDPERGAEMAALLTQAGRSVDPDMDASPTLAHIRRPIHIMHGRRDHLIPFTEGLRARDALPSDIESRTTITRLFGHSSQDPFPSPAQALREVPIFLHAMGDLLTLV